MQQCTAELRWEEGSQNFVARCESTFDEDPPGGSHVSTHPLHGYEITWDDHELLTVVARLQLRHELIQVAAVAVAAIEDLDTGRTHPMTGEAGSPTFKVLDDVATERERQEAKWGSQHHEPSFWMAILGEEFGEACQEVLHFESEAIARADHEARRLR